MARRTKAKTAPVEPEIIEEDDAELEVLEDDEEPEPEPAPRKRKRAKAAPVVEEPDEDDDDGLEDVEDEPEPTPKKAGSKRVKIEYGTSWAAEQVNAAAGTQHTAYTLRTLIRAMVKAAKFDREVGTDRSRYEFTGPDDPRLAEIIAFAKSKKTEAKTTRTDALAKARKVRADNLAKKKAAQESDEPDEDDVDEEPEPAPRKRRTKPAAKKKVVVEEPEDDEFEDLDDDE